jgi:putative protein-disulfide isomerase
MKPILIYCYDAWCGWCYGFSPVMNRIAAEYSDTLQFEVLSGGMMLPKKPIHISAIAGYVASEYLNVEKLTGIRFGEDYLWHINNPDKSDWYVNSEKPAIALCILKDKFPEKMIRFASDLQYALHYEGRDLTDDEAYRHLLPEYGLPAGEFYADLRNDSYKTAAYNEFSLVKKLGVKGFPALLLQNEEGEFHWISSGYTSYETICEGLNELLIKNS